MGNMTMNLGMEELTLGAIRGQAIVLDTRPPSMKDTSVAADRKLGELAQYFGSVVELNDSQPAKPEHYGQPTCPGYQLKTGVCEDCERVDTHRLTFMRSLLSLAAAAGLWSESVDKGGY